MQKEANPKPVAVASERVKGPVERILKMEYFASQKDWLTEVMKEQGTGVGQMPIVVAGALRGLKTALKPLGTDLAPTTAKKELDQVMSPVFFQVGLKNGLLQGSTG